MTEPSGAWTQEVSAPESRLQGKKEMVMVLTSKARSNKSLLLPIFSSVCQFYGDKQYQVKTEVQP